jgi:hypothetical protein
MKEDLSYTEWSSFKNKNPLGTFDKTASSRLFCHKVPKNLAAPLNTKSGCQTFGYYDLTLRSCPIGTSHLRGHGAFFCQMTLWPLAMFLSHRHEE